MKTKTISRLAEIIIEHYREFILSGIVVSAFAAWLYTYHYAPGGDDLLGVLAACSLFLGIILIGQGIRGWRDGEDYRNRHFTMKSRRGAELTIKKKKKREW